MIKNDDFEVAHDGSAYDAGFKPSEPRDWHGRWSHIEGLVPFSAKENERIIELQKWTELDPNAKKELKQLFEARKKFIEAAHVAATKPKEVSEESKKLASNFP